MVEYPELADQYRQRWRAKFLDELEAGTKYPFVLHTCLFAAFVLPPLYLAFPHKNRPWLYWLRWPLLVFCTWYNMMVILKVSSMSFVYSYGVGLVASCSTMCSWAILAWSRPQWEAKRVERLRREDLEEKLRQEGAKAATERKFRDGHVATSTAIHQGNGHKVGDAAKRRAKATLAESSSDEEALRDDAIGPADLGQIAETQEYVYVWQEYPENASFAVRFDWAADIATQFRMTGWNWAAPFLPPYRPPSWLQKDDKTVQLGLDSLPDRSPQGYTRCHSVKQLVIERFVWYIIPCYLVIDIAAVYMMKDPYFIMGPNDLPLPSHLANLHPELISLIRTAIGFFWVLSLLSMYWNLAAVLLAIFGPPVLGFRADVWHLPSFQGSFTEVFDRGLAGFWGSWWHQSFRFAFSGPAKWLIRHGYLQKGSTAANSVAFMTAFLLSAFLHASGSYTGLGPSNPWEPAMFFLLGGVGTQLQQAVCYVLRVPIEKMPTWVRRTGNFAFAAAWNHFTCKWLFDDMSRCGLFLFDFVPFSVMRWLGFGFPGDALWRWDRGVMPHWYSGKHFWNTGFSL